MAVRKGVELVVELSHRLADLEGQVWVEVVGGPSLWSDYRSLLSDLDTRTASFTGSLPHEDLRELYSSSDVVLQPSHYEPFALTVAEALASGAPVVASDEVGATEFVDRSCCRTFRAGDADELESAVRTLLRDRRSPKGPDLAEVARSEAVRAFSPQTVASAVVAVMEATVTAEALKRTP
jgi:glycosyltransferase involved in cell wall biosynthesis